MLSSSSSKADQTDDTNTTDSDKSLKRKLKLVVKNPSKLFPDSGTDKLPARQSTMPSDSPATTIRHHSDNPTPLLAASLSSPPVAIDLSASSSRQHSRSASPPDNEIRQTDAAHYTNLLLQLRSCSSEVLRLPTDECRQTIAVGNIKLSSGSAARRKEKLRMMPCFQCPVCKKRFQRHIAMNAHFQNEHILSRGQAKVCRLCSAQAPDIVTLRLHLATAHQIDLDNPLACLVEAEESRPEAPSPVKPPRSDDEDTSSSSSSSETIATTPDVHLPSASDHGDEPAIASQSQPVKRPAYSQKKAASGKKRKRGTAVAEEEPIRQSNPTTLRQSDPTTLRQSDTTTLIQCDDSTIRNGSYQCQHCQIQFPNQTLYFLHRGFHSPEASNPWRCNGCGIVCTDMYDFNTHLVSVAHK